MNMTIWNPLREMEGMLDRYNRASGRRFLQDESIENYNLAKWSPSIDIEESAENYLIHADIPGVDKKDIQVNFDSGVLTISGEKVVEKDTDNGNKQHRTERYCGSFSRQVSLPTSIQANKVDASYKDGVLAILIPKAAEKKPKAIEVKVH